MNRLVFDNRTVRELPGDPEQTSQPRQVLGAFWSAVRPRPVSGPSLVAHAPQVAQLLELTAEEVADEGFVQVFSGNRLLPGMFPYASCYGGHQFGQWAGQLGDGRAIGLGEVVNRAGERWELQLKGSGITPYSRRGDGLAVLRSSIREFLCSEAVHHLGIPTTRALSVIATGEEVIRDMFYDGNPRPEPGAVVCRVAPSFTRFGHFEIFASRGDQRLLESLLQFTIDRDFPQLASVPEPMERRARWFVEVCERTARLMVAWMRVGFVHGVMNTDNMSILGLTMDYGPYGWIDHFDPAWTPNTTDRQGRRYCFGRQAEIGRWNLERLADALAGRIPSADLETGLAQFDAQLAQGLPRMLMEKFGWQAWRETDADLVEQAFALMLVAEVDMTDFFRRLADVSVQKPDVASLRPAFYQEGLFLANQDACAAWLAAYAQRVLEEANGGDDEGRRARMNAVNPRFVLRNYIAQQAIDASESGDHRLVRELLEVLQTPYADHPAHTRWYALRPEWARHKAGCSMLSCSS
ncbi:MAG: YdiU family protein [Magnetococcus sp. MYC-9]